MRDEKTIIWSIWLTVITVSVGFVFGIMLGTLDFAMDGPSKPDYYAILTCLALPMFLSTFALSMTGLPFPIALLPGALVQYFCCLYLVAMLRWIWSKLPKKGRAWWALLVLLVFVAGAMGSIKLLYVIHPIQVQVAPEPTPSPADKRGETPPNRSNEGGGNDEDHRLYSVSGK